MCGSKIQPRPARLLPPRFSTFQTLRRDCVILLGLRSVLPQVEQFPLILYRECTAVDTSMFSPGTQSGVDLVDGLKAPFLELLWLSRAAQNAGLRLATVGDRFASTGGSMSLQERRATRHRSSLP